MKRFLLLQILLLALFHPSGKASSTEAKRFYRIADSIEQIATYQYHDAENLLQGLKGIAKAFSNNSNYYVTCLYLQSLINYNHGVYDTLLVSDLKSNLENLKRYQGTELTNEAMMEYSLALNYLTTNNYSESFFMALQALGNFKAENKGIFIAKALNILGNIASQIYSHNLAYDYYTEALSYLEPDDALYYQIKFNWHLANSFLHNHSQSLIDSLKSLLEPIKEKAHPSAQISIYSNLGGIYSFLGEKENSLACYHIITDIMQGVDNARLEYLLNYNLGYYYRIFGEQDSALLHYFNAYNIAFQLNNKHLYSSCLLEISDLYNLKDHTDSAYIFAMKYIETEESINNNTKIFETYQTYITRILDYSKREIAIKEKELLFKNRTLLGAVIAVIVFVVLVVLLLIIIRQKKNKQELLKENLDSKIREITSISLLLSNKNNLLTHIQDTLKQLPSNNDNHQKLAEVNSLIKNNLNTENDWDTFLMHFEKVHPNFFTNLRKYSNELTPSNLRFCAYFRIGLSTKEIATILNISVTTVKVSRFRIKRKLGLGEDDNLDDFIAKI